MLKAALEAIQDHLRRGRFPNEASVSMAVVLPVLNALGWPVFNPDVVCPEFAVEGRRVDFALCHPASKPRVFVEVKQVGQSAGAERQLFEYAYHKGVPLVILTDGREWNFFLPAEIGEYADRRLYKLDLIEREIDESVERLQRYLSYDSVRSGEALEAARHDYKGVARDRQIKEVLPVAWRELVQEEDSLLLELLADRVESLCGFKPQQDTVARFLRSLLSDGPLTPVATPPVGPRTGVRLREPINGNSGPSAGLPPVGFTLLGQTKECRNAVSVLVSAVQALAARDPEFLARFVSLPKHGTRRRYVARQRAELYPGRPELAEEHSRELSPGYWIGTNVSRAQVESILKTACEVAGIQYGSQLIVSLGT